MNKQRIYWLCQILGWSFYGILSAFLYFLDTEQASPSLFLNQLIPIVFHIGLTHLLRYVIIKRGWLTLSLSRVIPRIFMVTIILSFFNYILVIIYTYFIGQLSDRDFEMLAIFASTILSVILYTIWAMIYFTFHYFERSNRTLQYEAAAKEIELNNLRSQLNPHFIFNALNSIRALVDEDPKKSKNAITQLSNILRNSLMVDRKRLIPFKEELETVKDYLGLESVRYEERLRTRFDLDSAADDYLIPPLMVQTLVENAIKHGISTLRKGGEVAIKSFINNGSLVIQIRNAGQFENGKHEGREGYGLLNTKKRLELIYGNQSSFSIINEDKQTVLTEIIIPKTL
ncbi:MAG: sensor histidine kinase [Bacteroidota bacterium]